VNASVFSHVREHFRKFADFLFSRGTLRYFAEEKRHSHSGFLGLAWLGLELDKLLGSGLSLKLDRNLVKLKLFKNTNFYPKYSLFSEKFI
jgi:hypothetical protein